VETTTNIVSEVTAQIVADGKVVQVDLAQLTTWIAGIVQTVMRQTVTIGDPANARNIAAVQRTPASGAEMALMVKLVPGNPDLSQVCELLRDLIDQRRAVAVQLGIEPVDFDPSFTSVM
jgi:hypothetical protein